MKRTSELFDMIEAYLNDTLSTADKTTFETQMKEDNALVTEVSKHREMHHVLSDKKTVEFREKLQKVRQEMITSTESTEPQASLIKKDTRATYWKLAIAAVFVIGLGLLFWDNDTYTHEDLFAMYYTPYPVEDTTRGEHEDEMKEVYKSYTSGAHAAVIPELEKQLALSERQKLRLYLGNSYLNTDNTEKATYQFKKITEKSMFYEDAQWYLALTYLKKQVSDSTKYFLKNVIDYNGIHQKKAKKLLKKLK